MRRDPRYILPNSLQHVVDVTFQNRYLLCPSEVVNQRFLGVLGKARANYDMTICAVVVLSSHYHLLVRPKDGKHLADFMCFLKTNLAKEVGGKLRQWSGHFFDQRYHSTPVSDEEAAQVGVLRYLLSHGPKEGLVDTVREWPGVHSAAALIDGTPLIGRWYDRTAAHAARARDGESEVDAEDFASQQIVKLSPLPCWEHLATSTWRRTVQGIVDDIDREAAERRKTLGTTSLGATQVMSMRPDYRPDQVEKSLKPRFHTFDKQVLEAMVATWRIVIEAFCKASQELRSGKINVTFPEGTFPPARPFVPFTSVSQATRGHPA